MDYNPLTSVEVRESVETESRMCQPVHHAWCIYAFGIITVICVGLWLFFTHLV